MPKLSLPLTLILAILLLATPGAAQPAELGLVYSTAGRHYMVDLAQQRSVRVGPAPPRGSQMMSSGAFVGIVLGDLNPSSFTIQRFPADPNSYPDTLLSSMDFYAQFPNHFAPLAYQHGDARLASIVVGSDQTKLLFVACLQGMGEIAICEPFQIDLAAQQVTQVPGMRFYDTRVWLHPAGQWAVEAWDLACAGNFVAAGREQVQLSGMPTSAVWLADQQFVYSRYVCKGIFFPEQTVEPSYDLVLADANGQNERVLVTGMLAREMALSPDQQQLAFITSDPGDLGRDHDALWVVNLDGSGLQRIMDVPADTTDLRWDVPIPPAWLRASEPPPLPTVGEIAFINEGNVFLLDLPSGQTTTLVDDGTVGSPGAYGGIQIAWSPDGTQLAYASNRTGNYDIYLLDLATDTTTAISNDPADEFLPTFAPDGTLRFARLLGGLDWGGVTWSLVRSSPHGGLMADPPQESYEPIRLQALDGEQVMSISFHRVSGTLQTGRSAVAWDHDYYSCPTPSNRGTVFDAQWSPDGRRLAVIGADCWASDAYSWGYAWNNALFLVDAANPQRLPERLPLNHDYLNALAWSPDGAWLVVAQNSEQIDTSFDTRPDGLWLINLDAGDPQRISSIGQHPAWRPLTPEQIAALTPTATPTPPAPTPSATSPEVPSSNPTADAAAGGTSANAPSPAPATNTNPWALPLAIGAMLLVLSVGGSVGLWLFLRKPPR
ncbi:MAG: hypothetical protein EI684_17850 [Candidatus Viridilinea halotolerans]|uniref:WD40 repeat domain-containing protein n=1 Tax=Candidatus Viridilinea halotolerans TaxID=2491704 RepID=A0A426TTQ7_9CHLR|nr:MAG: hypothetical protein EI684_17850 [Candidatus Viridilinea halotolerans]